MPSTKKNTAAKARPSKVHRNFKLATRANSSLISRAKRKNTTQTAVIEKLLLGEDINLGPKAEALLVAEAQRRNQNPLLTLEAILIQALAK